MVATDPLHIRPACGADCQQLAGIYNFYIKTSTVTFEEVALGAEQMAARLDAVLNRGLPWLLAEANGTVLGYAYAVPWRERSAYRHSVEVSAYVDHRHVGRGVGSALYAALLPKLQALSLHTALAVVPLPNAGSVALYEKLGFVNVAHLKEVGFKLDRWVDVGYWQRRLDYNSEI